ncbi:MAG: iron-sulfur cluster-binding domain-containing protein [Oscillospiraceae bacterium]|nr:iron-sulfur cluster-binding domain-containing protein [Oscillospiraceae bacterium]
MKNKTVVDSSLKDIKKFLDIPSYRQGVIDEANTDPITSNFAVNSIANFLHPATQYLKIKNVVELSRDTKAFVLEPDPGLGTAKLAYFRPGQYISVTLEIGSSVVTRPYTICSSPACSLNDEYVIVIQKKPNGFASPFIFDTWVKGTKIKASSPQGNFYYQQLRDSRNVVGITDSQGFSSFLSMAEAISDKTIDIDLTLFYAARKQNEVVLADRFNQIASQTKKFRIIYVYSDERVPKCERGFITKTLIEKYAPTSKYSLFVNGSNALTNMLMPQIAELKLEKKYLRFGLSGQIQNPASIHGFPTDAIGKTFLCKVIKNGKEIATVPCSSQESLLVALEREGIAAPSVCRSGECGFCRSKLTKGNVFIPKSVDSRRLADSSHGIIHPCCSYPMSNLTLVIN